MTENIFNNSVEVISDTAVNNADTETTEDDTTVAPLSAIEPKQQRIGIRQRKLEYEEYKSAYLAPKILEQRKQTSISKELYNRIALMVRRLGGIDTTISGFIDSVLLRHMDDYAADHEIWRKL
ncbi:DUF3408 domain-containing protein [Duncaniella dubosii]|nr:DUF3408 domain-containing protein [Duncaniella dubosii]MCX4285623.1 DUF3408 domain-containing protein [Duncaniella dubosii]